MSERNKKLVRLAIERIWNAGDYASVSDFVTSDFLSHGSHRGKDIRGVAGVAHFFSTLRMSFPDLNFEIVEQIAEGDKVATRWRATGTHSADFLGIPPTGRSVTSTGIEIERLAGGKVVESWAHWDELGLLQQLGALDLSRSTGAR